MHPASVADYRLSVRARAQLVDIYVFTESKFGAYQAEAYHSGLERTFGLIAEFPRIGQPVDELAAGYRRFRFQSHYIYYTEEPAFVLIRTVIHCAQRIRPQLFE